MTQSSSSSEPGVLCDHVGTRRTPDARIKDKDLCKPVVVLVFLLGTFVLLQCLMPLRTAVKVGADEGFEYAKATLALNGYRFYTEIWNDQPLLHTFIITRVLKYLSPSVLGPRLVTSAFALLLLASVFLITYRLHDLLVASLATGFLIASPGFMELASSCMLEIPALAPAVAALCTLLVARDTKFPWPEILAGALFAAALQIKFIGVIYLPLVGLVLLARSQNDGSSTGWPFAARSGPVDQREGDSTGGRARLLINFLVASKRLWRSALLFAVSLAASFFAINLLIGEGSYLLQLNQSWAAHFASPKSLEYGSPGDHPFEWSILLKNWDLTIPAFVGILVSIRRACRDVLERVLKFARSGDRAYNGANLRPFSVGRVPSRGGIWDFPNALFASLPLVWLALTMLVFATHRPWWSHYYVHNAVPLCLCAAVGLAGLLRYPDSSLLTSRLGLSGAWRRGEPKRPPSPRPSPPGEGEPFAVRRRDRTAIFPRAQEPSGWRKSAALRAGIGVFSVCALLWMGTRIYLQIDSVRHSPRTYSSLVLKETQPLQAILQVHLCRRTDLFVSLWRTTAAEFGGAVVEAFLVRRSDQCETCRGTAEEPTRSCATR